MFANPEGYNFRTLTPSDTEDNEFRGLYVGTAGDLVVTNRSGVDSTIPVNDGALLPLLVTKVKATGTTATGILGLV